MGYSRGDVCICFQQPRRFNGPVGMVKDTEMKARIIGRKAIMKSFKFMFLCKRGEVLLRETGMSLSLQEKSVSASQGKLIEFIG